MNDNVVKRQALVEAEVKRLGLPMAIEQWTLEDFEAVRRAIGRPEHYLPGMLAYDVRAIKRANERSKA